MHHATKITFGKFAQKPFHGECACGTAIDSGSNEEARNFLAGHLARLQGINSGSFEDETVQPSPLPEPEGEPLSSGEGTAITSTSPAPGASENVPSNSASGTTDSSSAPSTDVRTEVSTEPSNSDGPEKSAATGTN